MLIVLQVLTGTLLTFAYDPVPSHAYASLLVLEQEVLFGRFVRSIHHWSANLLILVAFLHGLRVFLTGAFRRPRQLNWIFGVLLLLLLLASNFTGYLLPWDQLAYWGTTISLGMLEYVPAFGTGLQDMIRGGPEIGPSTLRTFFALHTAVLPLLLVTLAAFHFWRVRKAGGLAVPSLATGDPDGAPRRVPVLPDLLVREGATTLVVVAVVFLFSAFVDAPLGSPANPGLSPNPTRAPWYFAGMQEMLMHVHPSFAVCVIPALLLGAILCLPYLRYEETGIGVWFVSARGRRTAAFAAAAALLLVPAAILLDEYVLDVARWAPGVPPLVRDGLIPTVLFCLAVAGLYTLLVKGFRSSRLEAVQAVVVLLAVCFALLTVTCVAFRGQGMALTWPWPPGP